MNKFILPFLLASIMLIPTNIFGQKNMIEIIEEKQGDKIIVKAKNLSSAEIQLSLELTSKGFGLKSKEVFEEKIAPKQTQTIVKLIPQANKSWSYNISTSYKTLSNTPAASKTQERNLEKNAADVADNNQKGLAQESTIEKLYDKDDIVIYTKDKCGRCHRTITMLKASNIPFKERNITKNKKYHQEISTLLMENDFPGGAFTTPAIISGSELHYNIKDLESFVSELIYQQKK